MTVIYRWAEHQIDQMPKLATELVRRGVTVLATGGSQAAFAAKTAQPRQFLFFSSSLPIRSSLALSQASRDRTEI